MSLYTDQGLRGGKVTLAKVLGAVSLLIGIFANIWIFVKSAELARARRSTPESGRITVRERFRYLWRMSELAQRGEFSSVWLVVAVVAPWTAILLFSI
jgi:hypothetical protein